MWKTKKRIEFDAFNIVMVMTGLTRYVTSSAQVRTRNISLCLLARCGSVSPCRYDYPTALPSSTRLQWRRSSYNAERYRSEHCGPTVHRHTQ